MASISIQLTPPTLRTAAGGTASLSVEVRNLSSVVDRYTCELVGIDGRWWSVAPDSLELFPEASQRGGAPAVGRFTVSVHPPRESTATAGPWPIGAKVTSEHSGESTVEEATLRIDPFGAVEARLTPLISTGRRSAGHRIVVVNRGNRAETIELGGRDPEERLSFAFDAPAADVGPGTERAVGLQVRAPDGPFVGGSRVRPFTVEVRPHSDTPSATLAGTFRQHPLVSGRWLAAAVAAIVLIGAGATVWAAGLVQTARVGATPPPIAGAAADATANVAAVVTPAPAAVPTAAPAASQGPPTPTPQGPTPTPSPTPSPTVEVVIVEPGILPIDTPGPCDVDPNAQFHIIHPCLHVTSQPAGATIWVGMTCSNGVDPDPGTGRQAGVTDTTIGLSWLAGFGDSQQCGGETVVWVRVAMDGYEEAIQRVVFPPGEDVDLRTYEAPFVLTPR